MESLADSPSGVVGRVSHGQCIPAPVGAHAHGATSGQSTYYIAGMQYAL